MADALRTLLTLKAKVGVWDDRYCMYYRVPTNVNAATKAVIARAYAVGLVPTATTNGVHAPGSYHYDGRAVDIGLRREDLNAAGRTRLEKFQHDEFKRFENGTTKYLELIGPNNSLVVLRGVQAPLVEGSALENQHDNHVHVAAATGKPSMTESQWQKLRAVRRTRRFQKNAKNAGAKYYRRIIREARRAHIPIALGFALIEQESEFKNVWGHDPTIFAGGANPKTGRVNPNVTKEDYLEYKRQRDLNPSRRLMQGVGPAQLTWWEYQDEADRLGGTWDPTYNIRYAFKHLSSLIKANGLQKGIERYNGTGPAAVAYAKSVINRRDKWHRILSR
jgi:hypothetical protein